MVKRITKKTPISKIIGSKRIFFEIRKGKSKSGKSLGVFDTKISSIKVARKLSEKHPVTIRKVKIVKAPKSKSVILFLKK